MAMKNIYLVFELHAFMGPSIVIKAFSSVEKADKYAAKMAKKQKNKPQYDDWGLVEGIEYKVYKMKVS